MKKIITGLLLTITLASQGQGLPYPTKYVPMVNSYGNGFQRIWPQQVLHLPQKDSLMLNDTSKSPQIFVKGISLYYTDSLGNFYTVSGGAAGITALTGDGTASGSGSVVFTLATVNANLFGANTLLAQTLDGKGRALSARAANNSDINGALGYTAANNATTITINGIAQDISANRSWSIVAPTSTDNLDSVLSRGGQISTLRETSGGNGVGQWLIDSLLSLQVGGNSAQSMLINLTTCSSCSPRATLNLTGSQGALASLSGSLFSQITVQNGSIFLDDSSVFSSAHNGYVWTLLDSTTGRSSWRLNTGAVVPTIDAVLLSGDTAHNKNFILEDGSGNSRVSFNPSINSYVIGSSAFSIAVSGADSTFTISAYKGIRLQLNSFGANNLLFTQAIQTIADTVAWPNTGNKHDTLATKFDVRAVALSGAAGGDLTGTYPNPTIAANAVSNAKLAQMAAHTYKGNNTGSTANAIDVTSTQLTADLNLFTTSLQGLAPASGGGTTNFLRADGTWAAPAGGGGGGGTIANIGTGFPLGVAATNNIKKLSCNGCYFDSTSISNTLTLNVPNVFNVRNFCNYCTTGKYPGDGKMITANMTSGSAIVTATASVFVATDTGKIIKIDSAAIGNFDLIDTIVTVTDATHVIVHKNASHSVTTSTTCFGTDASGAIQGATNAATTAKGGTVWFPTGIYPTNDSVKTSIDGHNPNSQFYVHMITSSPSPYISPITITWDGEQAPELMGQSTPIALNAQPMNGSVIYSWAKQTSKSYTSILAAGEDSAFILNYVDMRVHKMEFMVCENIIAGGPAIGGLNFGNFEGNECRDVLVTIDQPTINSVTPTNNVFGFNSIQTSTGSLNIVRNMLVIGFKNAYVFGEHFDGDAMQGIACTNVLSPTFADHESKIGRLVSQWCKNVINPNVSYGGLAVIGTHTVEIFELDMEIDTLSANWWKYTSTITDPSNLIHGFANYKIVLRATHGYNSYLSVSSGAANFNLDSSENPVMHNRDNFFTGTTSRFLGLNVTNTSSGQAAFMLQSNGVTKWQMGMDGSANGNNNFYIFDQAHSLNRFLIDTSGNVNIGGNAATLPLLTLPLTGASVLNPHLYPAGSYSLGVSSFGIQTASSSSVFLANNSILNSSATAFLYDTVGPAAWIQFLSGSTLGRNAISGGTAGSPITFVTSFNFNPDKSGGIGGNGTALGSTGYWLNWTTAGNFTPAANNTQDFGASATRWATMYGVTGNFTAFKTGYVSTAISRTLLITDHSVEVTATGTTQTLPTAVGAQGQHYRIKLTATGSCTIATTSSQTIDGSTTYTLSAQNKYVELESNNVSWLIFANN